MYSRGTTPPTILSSNTNPWPASAGSRLMTTWPYWPLPPDWRMNFPSIFSTRFLMVSR
jgi:hypothetical protein